MAHHIHRSQVPFAGGDAYPLKGYALYACRLRHHALSTGIFSSGFPSRRLATLVVIWLFGDASYMFFLAKAASLYALYNVVTHVVLYTCGVQLYTCGDMKAPVPRSGCITMSGTVTLCKLSRGFRSRPSRFWALSKPLLLSELLGFPPPHTVRAHVICCMRRLTTLSCIP